MNEQLLKEITNEYLQEGRDQFKVGDGVKVHVRVREGDKERIQIFAGIVIARKDRVFTKLLPCVELLRA